MKGPYVQFFVSLINFITNKIDSFLKRIFRINGYSTVSTLNSVFIIGGFHSWFSSHIVKFTNDEVWENVGNLQQARRGHSSFLFGSFIFVIGGVYNTANSVGGSYEL